MRYLVVFLAVKFCFLSIPVHANSRNIYEPYLNDVAPKIVETVEEYIKDGVYVHKLKFLSRICEGQEVIIYGILAKPVRAGRYPGVLMVHGGGGCADQVFDQVFDWAKLGYVSFCQDEPGICSLKHRSLGPPAIFVRTIADANSLSSFSVYDGIVAALNGLRMLRSQADVDTSRVGVTGGSWGGYMTTMVSGLAGDRIKASFSHYGCGYYDLGSHWSSAIEQMSAEQRLQWLENFDAGRKASQITSHFMLTSPTNDWYFWPGAMMATYNAIRSDKNFCIAANANHELDFPGGTNSTQKGPHRSYMEVQWMNYHLKGIGYPFGSCTADATATRQGHNIKVSFIFTGVNPDEGVEIWYTYGETPYRSNYWKHAKITAEGMGRYAGLIPVYETELPILWYGIAYDRLDEDGREYSCSTTYQTVKPLLIGFKPKERLNEAFFEGFEQLLTRWKKPYVESVKGAGRYEFSPVAAFSGSKGLCLIGEQTIRCDGMRGLAFKRFAHGISMWVKNLGGTDFDIQLMAEEPNNVRHYWVAHQSDSGRKWVEVFVPWDKFIYQGSGRSPVEMLSSHLGQLGFATPPNSEIYIDDIATVDRSIADGGHPSRNENRSN